jgi:FAD/FMN-containing dehydrogenase
MSFLYCHYQNVVPFRPLRRHKGRHIHGCCTVSSHFNLTDYSQVVIANGSIVIANQKTNPDLHRALKGGGNNFGIVTRFDVDSFPNSKIWGGYSLVFNQVKDVSKWFHKFSHSATADPDSMTLLFMIPMIGQTISVALTTHSKADKTEAPAVFINLNRLIPNI